MLNVPFPSPQFKIRKRGEKQYIFDKIRKAWVALTEEEWVRQNMIAYLTIVLHYPIEFFAVEKKILVNSLTNRFDILIYNKEHQPWMLVECKAPQVAVNEGVLRQALRYHSSIPVDWIVLSNGERTLAWKKIEGTLQLAENFPTWDC